LQFVLWRFICWPWSRNAARKGKNITKETLCTLSFPLCAVFRSLVCSLVSPLRYARFSDFWWPRFWAIAVGHHVLRCYSCLFHFYKIVLMSSCQGLTFRRLYNGVQHSIIISKTLKYSPKCSLAARFGSSALWRVFFFFAFSPVPLHHPCCFRCCLINHDTYRWLFTLHSPNIEGPSALGPLQDRSVCFVFGSSFAASISCISYLMLIMFSDDSYTRWRGKF
jgi:hypothetical protein